MTNASGDVTSFSAPVYRWTSTSGSPLSSTDNSIQWTDDAIYYLYYNSATKQKELRRTVVAHSYYSNLSLSQRQVLLAQIQTYGTPAGRVPSSYILRAPTVLLKNVTSAEIGFADTGNNAIDAYADTQTRQTVDLGSTILSAGAHQLKFKIVGTSGTGYSLGIDDLIAGGAGLPVEAEYYLPPADQNGATPVLQNMIASPGWRNNATLEFPAAGPGAYFTLNVYNDTWMESLFNGNSVKMDKTKIAVVPSDGDQMVQMEGNGVTWEAVSQAAAAAPVNDEDRQNASIRVLIAGGDPQMGGSILYSGRKVKVTFAASPTAGALSIVSACIMERDSGFNGKSSTVTSLLFGGGASVVVPAGGTVTSDAADVSLDRSKDYLVSFKVTKAPPGLGIAYYPAAWEPSSGSVMAGQSQSAFVSGDDANHAINPDWSSLSVTTTSKIIGVAEIFSTYPDTATYTSAIVDTRVTAPQYQSLYWTGDTPSGTGVTVKARSGNQPDLSDAADWSTISGHSAPGTDHSLASVPAKRYAQFQAVFTSPSPYSETASLHDVKITWPGNRRSVQFSADLDKGPTRGKFVFTVDGQELRPPWVRLNFTIGKTYQGKTYSEKLSLSVQPRNP